MYFNGSFLAFWHMQPDSPLVVRRIPKESAADNFGFPPQFVTPLQPVFTAAPSDGLLRLTVMLVSWFDGHAGPFVQPSNVARIAVCFLY